MTINIDKQEIDYIVLDYLNRAKELNNRVAINNSIHDADHIIEIAKMIQLEELLKDET
jgi:hypothetical protein